MAKCDLYKIENPGMYWSLCSHNYLHVCRCWFPFGQGRTWWQKNGRSRRCARKVIVIFGKAKYWPNIHNCPHLASEAETEAELRSTSNYYSWIKRQCIVMHNYSTVERHFFCKTKTEWVHDRNLHTVMLLIQHHIFTTWSVSNCQYLLMAKCAPDFSSLCIWN